MTQVWPTIERFLAEHGAAVLVTLAESAGSSPREVGTRMVVRPDGRFSGTIGGGALEWLALAEAQQMMASSAKTAAFRRLNKALGPELGQCCGGRVVVTLERFEGRDLDKVVPLAAAERAGRFLTVSEPRSEEHTSELQSHSDLVCRLLLEKKKAETSDRIGRLVTPVKSHVS